MSFNKLSSDIIEPKNDIQAVLLADNFTHNFSPISHELPVALLPLVNVPLIDYTLESLSLGGVTETFLFCCHNVDKMKEHIRKSIVQRAGWSITMNVNIIVSESCRSLGDALRDLDAKGLLRGDFILINADTVSNINFVPILQKHIAITKKDKGAAMTLIYQNIGTQKNGNFAQEDILLACDSNNRILFHQKAMQSTTSKKIQFPLEIFLEHNKVRILNNLRDTHIAICSGAVLPLFTDNFDYQTRDDFVRGLLMNEEILASTLYWHELSGTGSEYAARVTNWNMYQIISHDIIHRWVYPFVPDMGISSQQQTYVFRRNHIYKHRDVKLAKGTELLEDVVIAKNTKIDQCSEITRSVIGENCEIGKNVKINDSFILANTKIGDNCTISFSFLGNQCQIAPNAQITQGTIIGSKTRVDNGVRLEGDIIQAEVPENSEPINKLGSHCYRVRCISKDEDRSDSEDEGFVKQLNRFHLNSDGSESDSDSSMSTISNDQMSHMASPIPDDTNLFLSEVIDSLARGFDDKLQCDNLILEINSSRYAYNVTVREVNFNVVKAILNLPFQKCAGDGQQPYLLSLRSLLSYFMPILVNYIRNEAAMVDCLQALQDVADTCSELNECVSKVLHWFYEKDVLAEDAILEWHSKLIETSRLYQRTNPFIQWLQEADEETDSD